jgi:acyl-CoA synthetase (AMP-forming)/AMP-acid ligase II
VSSATDPVREGDHRSSGTGAARRIGFPNLNPVRLYERWEAAAALMSVSASVPDAPYRMLSHLGDIWRWRSNPAGIVVLGAARNPTRIALIDDDAEVTFAELDRRTNAVAASWRAAGLGEHSIVGVLARNGRLFMEASIAATKLGADVVYLNGSFAPAQVADVVAHEGIDVLFYDDELAPAAALANPTVAVTEAAIAAAGETGNTTLMPPSRTGRVVVLTSGTTGRPKGAGRDGSTSPGKALDAAGILSCIPFAPGERAVIAAPLFHGLGLFTANLTLMLNGTLVLRRRFDPEQVLRDIAEREATLLVAVPVMLQRILELPRRTLDMYDTSSLRLVISGGAALAGELAQRFMDRFGDVLYNVYGSSETALATVALPRDLRAAPGTAGHPVPGVKVAILDDGGRPVPNGATGRVFVGSPFGFDGYTGGGSKDVVAGMLATGDLGHLDRRGRLSIDGREDDMIVSGGENVFPGEVEDLLSTHAAVAEVSVIGVPDPDYGQRLRAFVVPRAGATATAEELRDYVHDRLARFKTPREIVFVSTLPRTATGKVLKRELRTMEVESQ